MECMRGTILGSLLLALFCTCTAVVAAPSPPEKICLSGPSGETCTGTADTPTARGADYPATVKRSEFHPGQYIMVGPNSGTTAYKRVEGESNVIGVKQLYEWRSLETAKGVYDFSQIERDLSYLKAMGKRLFLQIRYTAYNGRSEPKLPKYIWKDSRYGCGVAKSTDGRRYYGVYPRVTEKSGGWFPCYWDRDLQERFAALYKALGKRFNSEPFIEGIALDETATSTDSAQKAKGYSVAGVEEGFKAIALAAKKGFPSKSVIQLVNFAVFDVVTFSTWLEKNGIGIGGPDVSAQPNKLIAVTYDQYLRLHDRVPTGPNVEWSNYSSSKNKSVEHIYEAAVKFTNPWYIFWMTRAPYFENEVIPLVRKRGQPPAAQRFYGK